MNRTACPRADSEQGSALVTSAAAAGAGEGRDAPPARRLAERLADRVEDALGLEGLDDEVLRSELDRLEHLGLLAQGRAHDHLRRGIQRHDVLQGGQAVLLGHGDVEGREIGLQGLELRMKMSAEEFEVFFEKYEQACYEEGVVVLRLHLALEAGRVFCFNMAPDADAVRRAHDRVSFPFDSITEVTTATPGDIFFERREARAA